MFEDKDKSEQINNTYAKVIRLLLEEIIVYLELNPTADQTEGKNIVFELMTYNLV